MTHEQSVEFSPSIAADRRRTGPPTMTSRLWYRAVFGDALVDACQIPIIREHFVEALGVAGWPEGACLFLSTRHVRGKAVRAGVSAVGEAIYFSPAAIAEVPYLIAVCGAVPSPPPDRECSLLLVGTQSDWDLLPRGPLMRRPGSCVCYVLAKGRTSMSSRHLRVYIASTATSLTLLSCLVAATSPRPTALLLTMIVLVPLIIVPLRLAVPANAAGTECRR